MPPTTTNHILGSFNEAFASLRESVILMSSLAERNLASAMTALLQRDSEAASLAIVEDEDVDILEKQVDQSGVNILVRFSPVASDLRQVVAHMKVSNNLERVSDESVTIARRARKLNQRPSLAEAALLEPLYHKVLSLLRDSLRAYIGGDAETALTIKARDKEIDLMHKDVMSQLTQRMSEKSDAVEDYLSLVMICRSLERIGDHATNIATDTVFAEQARDIRHTHGKAA